MKLLYTIIVGLLCVACIGQKPTKTPTFDDLLDAIKWVESKGEAGAVGDYKVISHYETCSHSPICPDWDICNDTHCMIAGVYQAIGAYQIHKVYVDDVNRILELWKNKLEAIFDDYHEKHPDPNNIKSLHFKPFAYDDRWDRDKSRYMTEVYLTYYAPLDDNWDMDFEAAARIHNGGPNGWKKESTKAYWLKVKERLDETLQAKSR